jgi:hypothetical protein
MTSMDRSIRFSDWPTRTSTNILRTPAICIMPPFHREPENEALGTSVIVSESVVLDTVRVEGDLNIVKDTYFQDPVRSSSTSSNVDKGLRISASEQLMVFRNHCCCGATIDLKLAIDGRKMRVYRTFTNKQLFGNLVVRQSFSHEPKDVDLAGR